MTDTEDWRIAQARIDIAQALRLLDKGPAAYPAARTLLSLAADGIGKVIMAGDEK